MEECPFPKPEPIECSFLNRFTIIEPSTNSFRATCVKYGQSKGRHANVQQELTNSRFGSTPRPNVDKCECIFRIIQLECAKRRKCHKSIYFPEGVEDDHPPVLQASATHIGLLDTYMFGSDISSARIPTGAVLFSLLAIVDVGWHGWNQPYRGGKSPVRDDVQSHVTAVGVRGK